MNKKYMPVFVEISLKPVLVIGAGMIAHRKIMNLLDFGADVVCIAPQCVSEIEKLSDSGEIKYIKREYQSGDTKDFDYVFAATNNPEADQQIYDDCKKDGTILNVADVPELCTFIVPAYIKRGNITFSVSTGGTAPFYAKHLKDKLNETFTDRTGEIAELASYFRKKLVADEHYNDEKRRNEKISWFLRQNWDKNLSEHNFEESYKIIDLFFKNQ